MNPTPQQKMGLVPYHGHFSTLLPMAFIAFFVGLAGCRTSAGDLLFNSATAAGQTVLDLGLTAFVNGVADALNPTSTPPADQGSTNGGGGGLSGLTGDATNGQMLFTANGCLNCHCTDASGGCALSAPNIQGVPVGTVDDRLRGPVSHPGGKFTLTDQEIADIQAFLASL